LVFQKKKNSETFHVNSASELIHSHWFFEIKKKRKKLFTLVNSYSGASFIFVHDKAHKPLPFNITVPQTRSARQIWDVDWKNCFSQTRSNKMLLLLNQRCHVGPTHWKCFYFDYQTLINMVAGEPHPQPRYQTASYSGLIFFYFQMLKTLL
jgi:hypothetical protein